MQWFTYPDGSKTIAAPSGAVFNADTPHYGSTFSLKPNEKLGVESIRAATAVNPNDARAGYRLWSQVGNPYQFDAEFVKNHGI
jgi:hypothetical protein